MVVNTTAETKRWMFASSQRQSVGFLFGRAGDTSPLVSGLSAYLHKNIIQRCDHTLKVSVLCVRTTDSIFV